MPLNNPNFISSLATSITGSDATNDNDRLKDGTDTLNANLINALNIATSGSFVASGGNITMSAGSSNTIYAISEIKYFRDGKLLTMSALSSNNEPTWNVNANFDWFGLIVIADGTETGEGGSDVIKFRGSSTLGETFVDGATPKNGDIPIAAVHISKASTNTATNRKIQFLGMGKLNSEFSAVNNGTETLRINKDGTITKGGQTITLPSTTGNVVTTGDTGTITAAMLGANSVDSSELVDGSIDTSHIADDQVTYAKIQNVSATNRILGRDSSGAGIIEEITPANLRTMINVEDGADVTDTTNVKAALNADLGGSMTIGDANDTVTVAGDLVVTGTTTTESVETVSTSNGVVFEGSVANNHEITLKAGTVTTDRTITLPNATGTVALTSSDITGNAATATQLETGRTINGVTFDGTSNITVTAAAGTLTGNTLKSSVTASSLTSVGTIGTGTWQGTPIADAYISSASTWNAKLPTIDSHDLETNININNDLLLMHDDSASGTKEHKISIATMLGKITASQLAGSGKVFATLPESGAEVNQNAFTTVAVSGQSNVEADQKTDTLTLAAGGATTITTAAGSDTITVSSTNTTYSAGNGIALSGTTFSVAAGEALTQTSTGLELADPATLPELTESTDNGSDKILLWDESTSAWKYMSITNLEDSIGTYTAGAGLSVSSNVFSHDSHTGEVTGSSSLTIANNVVDEANLKVSNTPTDGYFLSAQSGNTGGLTWAVPANTQLTQEQVEDYVNGLLVAGSNITKTYDDAAGTLTIASTDTNTQLTTEQVQDIVGAMFTSNTETRISATYEDGDGTIDLVVDDMTADTNTQLSNEQVQDIVGAMFSGNTETNITATYQDADGTIDLVASGGDVVDDTSPQLGGDLDVNGHKIVTTSDADLIIEPDGTGDVIIKGTQNGPGVEPILILKKNDSGPDDSDFLGLIRFDGKNSNGDSNAYAGIRAKIQDQTDGTEDGKLEIVTEVDGTFTTIADFAAGQAKVYGNLQVQDLLVLGTQTIVDTVTMNAANAVVFEGATADNYETTLTITDPTADRTITLPNSSGTVALTSQLSDTQYDFSVPGGTTALRLGGATASGNTNDDVTLSGGTNLTAVRTSETQITFNVDDAFLKNDGDDTTTGTITAAGLNLTAANDTPLVIQNTTNTGYAGIQFSDNSSNSYGQKGEFRFQHSDANSQGSGASFHFTTTEADLSIVGGKFIASDASASEPGFGFAGDVDTGMYQSAANTIQFVTAGTNRMQIASGGAVSINNDVSITKTLPSNDATTLSGAQAFVVDCIDDQSSSSGPGFAIRLEATNDHNGPNYTKTILGDGGGMRVKNIFGNYGFSEWWLGGTADGPKPIMSLAAGGSTSAGEAQDGILTLYSTTSNWANNTYSPSNNTAKVVLDAGGDSYFKGGDVGIGTSSINGILHIRDESDGSDQYSGIRFFPADSETSATDNDSYHNITGFRKSGLMLSGGGSGNYTRTYATLNNDGFKVFTNAGDNTAVNMSTQQRMIIPTGGGASTFYTDLNVSGDTTIYDGSSEAHLILRRDATGANYGAAIKWQFGDSGSSSSGHEYARITGNIQDSTDGSEDGYLTLQTSKDGTLTEAVRINKDGNVGMGSTSPDAKLRIHQTDGSVHGLKVSRNDSSTSTPLVFLLDDSVYVDNPTLHVRNDRADQYGYSALFEGRVGIGQSGNTVTAPDQQLHIEGSILVDAYNQGKTTVASNYSDGETSLVLTDASTFNEKGTGTIDGVKFSWTGINYGTNTLTVPDLNANYASGVTVAADTGLFFREGFETAAQPSVTIYDQNNSGASRDDLSLNANAAIRMQLANNAEVLLTDDKLSLTPGNEDVASFVFRNRADLGMFESGYNLQLAAPENVYVQIDSNNNNAGTKGFIVQKDSNGVGGGTEIFKVMETGAVTINQAFTLPTADGSANQVLKTDGSGTVSWAADSGGSGSSYDGDITTLDIDGGTDIGEAIADADLIIVDNGAGGTNRKATFSRVKTWIGGNVSELRIRDARADGDITPDDHTDKAASFHFTDDITGSPNSWDGVLTMKGWGDSYTAWQLLSSNSSSNVQVNQPLYFRTGEDTTWSNLRKVITEDNNGRVGIGNGGNVAATNTLEINHSGADGDNGIMITRDVAEISQNDILGGIGFDSHDGNDPSSVLEASVAIIGRAREDHSTGDKGGYLDFYYSPTDQDDDTASRRGMRMMQGKLSVGGQNDDVGDPINSLVVEHAGSDWHNGILILRDDTSIVSGNLLGAIGFDGKDGNNPSSVLEASAGIASYAAEDHSTGDKGGHLAFFTSPIDQDDDTASIERVRITSEGLVGIGTTSPSQTLHVQSSSAGVLIESTATSGEAPVLDLYKNDSGPAVSEAMASIKFSGENDQDQKVTYAEIQSFIEDETDATENAALQFFVQEMGTPRENLRLASNKITFNNSERNVDVLIKSDDGSENFFSDAGTNQIGIGNASPEGALDIRQDNANNAFGLVIGADVSAKSLTDNVRKFTRIGMHHYHNTEEHVNLIVGDSDGTDNKVSVGGGTNQGNAATKVQFYAAANDATVTGTVQANITSSGLQLGTSGARVTTILDEDAMGSNSATALATQQSIKAYVDANAGGTDTNTFVIVGEESDDYITSTAAAGNTNGYQFSFGNGAQNTTKSSSGDDFGVVLPVACTLSRIDITFGNKGSETNSNNQTLTVYKNFSSTTTTMSYNASGTGGNAFVKSFSSLSGNGLSYSAGDTFNLRTTGLSGYTDTQVGPARMTAYFTVA